MTEAVDGRRLTLVKAAQQQWIAALTAYPPPDLPQPVLPEPVLSPGASAARPGCSRPRTPAIIWEDSGIRERLGCHRPPSAPGRPNAPGYQSRQHPAMRLL